jgi:ribonucleoside-diphosphate reductase alpha subunit
MNSEEQKMFVVKRDGRHEEVAFDKVQERIAKAAKGLSVNVAKLTQQVLASIVDKITTTQLDTITANLAVSLTTTHPDYADLAARIAVSNHQKNTPVTLLEVTERLHAVKDKVGADASILDPAYVEIVRKHATKIEARMQYERDFLIDFFGFKTLEKAYLLRDTDRVVVERPQHLWMRVAIGLWGEDLDNVFESYDGMSRKVFTHATPTLFNAGTKRPQLSSCFLLAMKEDSIRGIYSTLEDCALISQYGGGIGLHASNIRAKGALIKGTGGVSNGIVPMLRVFNTTARYVDQGGGKRNGSFAIYLEPWHADVEDFLEMKKNTGSEEERARDLFYALWIPDLFMERVVAGGTWTLFCPSEAPGLADVVGKDFQALYERYEAEGRGRKTIKAQALWFQILGSQIETGTPYLLYKDAANLKSNQQNLGVIKSSNLCTEIIEYSDKDETAVCNLASLSLPAFVKDGVFDFAFLRQTTKRVIKNLNRVIDINYYPIPEAKRSNMRHRPVGLGVQGLADVFAMLGHPWESEEARTLNKRIFAHMYYAALESSAELAYEEGPYETYAGSPASKGKFQYHLWNVDPLVDEGLDWNALACFVRSVGLRNSLLVAPMPTASTSQILGNCECIEPYTSHIFTRRTLAGEFIVINKHLVKALLEKGLWTPAIKDAIIGNNGSVLGLPQIPEEIQRVFKTVWEIKQKVLIDMAADRGAYICQSQSLNLFLADPDFKTLSSMHVYTWRKGLKTGIYYLRTRPAASAQKFTIEPVKAIGSNTIVTHQEEKEREKEEEKECTMCSS